MPLRRCASKDADDSSLDRCALSCLQSQVSIGLHLFDALARWRLVCEAALLPLVAAVAHYLFADTGGGFISFSKDRIPMSWCKIDRVQTIKGLPL